MKINSLEDLKNMPTEVRVLANTTASENEEINEEMNKMVGGIFEQIIKWDYEKARSIYTKDKLNYYFKESDLQELTPLEYNGYRIGIGDWVYAYDGRCEVYGYYWYDGEFYLNTARVKNGKPNYSDCRTRTLEDITDIKPLYKKEDEATTQAIELLKKNGYKVIKE